MFQRLSSHIVDLVAAVVYVCALGFMVFGHEDNEAWKLILSFAMLMSEFA